MAAVVAQRRTAFAELCRQYRVERLYVFGSAVSDRFDTRRSDLDLLVRICDHAPTGEYAARYLGLAEALEQFFGRPVDLVTEESIRNPTRQDGDKPHVDEHLNRSRDAYRTSACG
jgi:predicted nucleotidyltransferase